MLTSVFERARWRAAGLWLLPLVFLVLMLFAPLLRLGSEAGTETSAAMWLSLWQDDYLRWRVLWSFLQAALTCVAALFCGLPVAWVLARYTFTGRLLVLRLLMLPFVVPTLVAAMGVLALWGARGLLSGWLGLDLQDTPWLLLYGNLFFNLCLVVRAGVDALGRVSASRVAAARTLGATPWRVFWRVEWPAILPWLASALCLVFLYCFSGFGLALILGGQKYATVEVEIYTLVAHELKLAQAGVLALCMLLLTGTVALIYAAMERRLATPARTDVIALRRPAGVGQWASVAAALAVLVFFCALPLLAILARALGAGSGAWAALVDAETIYAVWNTLRFTAVALLLATALGMAHAFAARRSVVLRAAAFLPFVVSPVTVAFGLLLLYPQWSASMLLLVCAYALLAYPFVAQSLGAALDSQPEHLLQAARTLGASPWRGLLRVTLPLAAPSLRRGMAFAAATALGEFAVTLFLSRPEWATLTTLIYERLGRPGATNRDSAMVLASLLMLLALLVFLLIENPPRGASTRGRKTPRKELAHA
ncbi:MAG: iron ABC transporter permease [Rhodoferax sp.]|nr:iron ABC transporter permease [Rhodoferax sp.]